MTRTYTINGKQIRVDDAEAVRALSPAEFADLLKQTQAPPPTGEDERPDIPQWNRPEGTGFAIFDPPSSSS